MENNNWVLVGEADSIEMEDLIRFDHKDKTYCVYHIQDGFFATDGICTHEAVHLQEGFASQCLLSSGHRFQL